MTGMKREKDEIELEAGEITKEINMEKLDPKKEEIVVDEIEKLKADTETSYRGTQVNIGECVLRAGQLLLGTTKENNVESSVENVSKDIFVYSLEPVCFLSLPPELVTKIIYLTFLNQGSSQALYLLYTCKYLYYRFFHMIYALKPLFLSSKASSRIMNIQHLKSKTISASLSRVKMLNIIYHSNVISSILTTLFVDVSNFETQLHSNLYKFTSLKSLNIKSHTISSLKVLEFAPETIENFSLIVSYKPSINTARTNIKDLAAKFLQRKFHLKTLSISTNKPITSKKINSLLCLSFMGRYEIPDRTQFEVFSQRYSQHSIVKYYELLRRERRFQLEYFGDVVFEILRSSHESIQLVEMENIDLDLIFDTSKDLSFPKLQLLILDKTSDLRIFRWLPYLQSCNQNSSMILFMNDHWASRVFATNIADGPVGVPTTWKCFRESTNIIRYMKERLMVHTSLKIENIK